MYQHLARAGDQIAFAVAISFLFLPVASACDLSDLQSGNCGLSRGTVIAVVVGCGVLGIILAICAVFLRRRRSRRRMIRFTHVDNGMGGLSPNLPKPPGAPFFGGNSLSHQAASPPLPVYMPQYVPQYPPRGYELPHSYSPQSLSRPPLQPATPVSPTSTRRSLSGTLPRPTPPLDTPSPSIRFPLPRDEPARTVSPPSSGIQTNTVASPRPSQISSPPPRSPAITISSAPTPSVRTTGTASPLNAARPSALPPVHTGTSTNIEEPPPAYTPI